MERPDPITKAYIAELSNKSKKLEIELVNALILFHEQQKKDTKKTKGKKPTADKKRPAPEPAAVGGESPAKKEKKKKEKPEGWLCSGNVVDGTPCPLEAEYQVFDGRLKHEGKLVNACKVCKKSTRALLKTSSK